MPVSEPNWTQEDADTQEKFETQEILFLVMYVRSRTFLCAAAVAAIPETTENDPESSRGVSGHRQKLQNRLRNEDIRVPQAVR